MPNPKVFVVNQSGHNINPVTDVVPHAEVIYLSEGNVNIFNTDRVIREFSLRLIDANPGDYLLLSGSIAINLVAFGILLEKCGSVNILLWQAKERRYVPRTITKEMLGYGQI